MTALYEIRRWLLLAVMVALGAWYTVEPAQTQAIVRSVKRDEWKLEPLPKPVDNPIVAAQVGSAAYWGAAPPAPVAASAPEPPPPRWRIAGLMGHGATRSILLSYPDLPQRAPQILRVGDALPNGDRIIKIEDREFQVQSGTEVQTRLIQALAPGP